MKRFFDDNNISSDPDEIAATHVAYARCVACLRKFQDAGLANLTNVNDLTKGVVALLGRVIWASLPDEYIKVARSIHDIYGSVCSCTEGDPDLCPVLSCVLHQTSLRLPSASARQLDWRRSCTPAPRMSGSF
jgi:hypothetical protein